MAPRNWNRAQWDAWEKRQVPVPLDLLGHLATAVESMVRLNADGYQSALTRVKALLEREYAMIDDQVNPQTEVEQLFVRTSELARQLAEMDPEEARQRFREMGLGAKEQAMLLAAVLALRGEDDVGHK
jgi:hypothetical protein